jgi:quercetin dioxygenase-like cupin family protein
MPLRLRSTAIAAFAFSVLMTAAHAQDPVAVDPAHHKVEFENDQIRVIHVVFPPGESSVMHTHPCLIAIGIADGELTFRLPDGSTRPAPIHRGEVVIVRQPITHNPVNNAGTTHDVMVVELKTGCPK